MTETRALRGNRTRADVPEIMILASSVGFTARPVTLFEVELVAGEVGEATLVVSAGSGHEPMIALRARAGARERFVPAAPVFLRERLHFELSGADATGVITFR